MLGLGVGLVKNKKQGSAFTVDSLSEVITWLKADTDITETSVGSGVVARWRDQVGTTDWVSNQTGRQPAVSGTGTETKLVFDGGDRLYQKEYSWNTSDDAFDFDFSHDVFDVMNAGAEGGFSTFAVMEVDSSLAQTAHTIFGELHFVDDGTPGSGFTARTDIVGLVSIHTKGDFVGVAGIDASVVAFNNATSAGDEFPLDEKFLVTIEYAGGKNSAVTVRVNKNNKTLNVANILSAGTVTVGMVGNNTNGIKGNLYELINCSTKLSSDNRALVEGYLMERHNIS